MREHCALLLTAALCRVTAGGFAPYNPQQGTFAGTQSSHSPSGRLLVSHRAFGSLFRPLAALPFGTLHLPLLALQFAALLAQGALVQQVRIEREHGAVLLRVGAQRQFHHLIDQLGVRQPHRFP